MLANIAQLVQRRPAQVLRALAGLLVLAAIVGGGVLDATFMAATPGIEDGLVRAQVLAALISVGLLLFTTRGAVRAGMPVAAGAVGVVLGLGLLRLLAEATVVAAITPAVVALLAIVLAVPSTLYVVNRFREELAAGYTPEVSASRVVQTTGRTITFGAMTISLAIAGLLVLPSGQLRALATISIGVVIITALTSVLVLPALLSQLGVRVDRLALASPADEAYSWRALTGRFNTLPPAVGLGIAALLAATALPFLGADLTSSSTMIMTDAVSADDIGGRAPAVIAIVLIGAFVVLALEFSSLLVPAKAIMLNLLGLCPAFGLLAVLADDGSPDPTVTIVLFTLGFGLVIEPLVYVLTRIKEEHDLDGDHGRSIDEGLRQAAGPLDNAAAVSAAIIIAFTAADALPVRELALGLTVAIAAHALIVRPLVLPTVMRLSAASNWWAPAALRQAHERLTLTANISLTEEPSRPSKKPRPAKPTEPSIRVIGPYRLLQSLGRSHHSETFVVEGPAGMGPERLALTLFDDINVPTDLVNAAAAMGRYGAVESEDLAVLYDVGLWEGHLYYSAELGEGGSLAMPTTEIGRDVAVRVVADAARGLDALHAAGLYHRDIRPRTVILRGDGGMLAGLGIVQLLAESQRNLSVSATQSSAHHKPINDPAYAAPEILEGGDATVASEVYALGLTLHEAVAGVSVYGELPENPAARRAHVQAASVTISPTLPVELQALLQRCLARDPAERFESCVDVADALSAARSA